MIGVGCSPDKTAKFTISYDALRKSFLGENALGDAGGGMGNISGGGGYGGGGSTVGFAKSSFLAVDRRDLAHVLFEANQALTLSVTLTKHLPMSMSHHELFP